MDQYNSLTEIISKLKRYQTIHHTGDDISPQ